MTSEGSPGTELGLADLVCLALVCDGHTHGWAVAKELAPDGPLGRIWTLSRPLTYRAIDRLLAAGLLTSTGSEAGRGPSRRLLAPTRAGRRRAGAWLDEPVRHLRHLRTELLLKLDLRARAGMSLAPFVGVQRDALAPVVGALERADTSGDPVALWRREQARAVRRFLDALAATATTVPDDADDADGHPAGDARHEAPDELRLSARNQLDADVTDIALGDHLVTVTASVAEGEAVSAVITRAALDDLDLVEGDRVVMISKAADTVVGVRARSHGW